MNARYWPYLGVKVFAGGLTPAIRFSCLSVPRTKEARMNVRYRVELSHAERTELRALLSGGKQAARKLKRAQILLVATACSNPPEGRARWTLELLADELVRLTEHDSLSRETVRRRLAENDLKPWRKDMWCIPKVDA